MLATEKYDCILFEPPDYGLCNRLRGLVGAWGGSKKLSIPLYVIWKPSPACPYKLEDLFQDLSGMTRISSVSEIPEKYTKIYHTTSVSHLNDILKIYNINISIGPFLMNQLKPISVLMDIIQEINREKQLMEYGLGIHIRETDIVEYLSAANIRQIPVIYYYTQIEKWLKQNDTNVIYLACDNADRQNDILNKYGKDKIVIYKNINKTINDNSIRETGGDHCVIDLFCLSRCKEFIGTPYSSFSTHVHYLK